MATKKTARTASSKTITPTQATRSTTTTNKPSAPTPFQRPADGTFWLMKSEPDVYGIVDLERDGTTGWEGVRNALARNYMRDHMRVGDRVLFYHSNAAPSGVAGIAEVASTPLPDPSQFDPRSDVFDAGSTPAATRWMMVRLSFVERFPRVLPLERLREEPALDGMPLLQRGQRLSVQPVSRRHFLHILQLAGARTA
jgi:predicted RNA-binding protein with PUA-like domain